MKATIEQQVMANVGVIYTARQFVGVPAIKLYVLFAGLIALVQLTWVHKVFANWAAVGFDGSLQFVSYALLHTHPAVQVTLAALAVVGISLLRDLVRPTRSVRLAL
jgi:hypothetical protein